MQLPLKPHVSYNKYMAPVTLEPINQQLFAIFSRLDVAPLHAHGHRDTGMISQRIMTQYIKKNTLQHFFCGSLFSWVLSTTILAHLFCISIRCTRCSLVSLCATCHLGQPGTVLVQNHNKFYSCSQILDCLTDCGVESMTSTGATSKSLNLPH